MKFLNQLTKIINTGQSRSVILTGNIHDLFYDGQEWVPLMNLLQTKCKVEKKDGQKGITQILYQVNRPIEVIGDENLDELDRIWSKFHTDTKSLKQRLGETLDNTVYALELLRQITECARRGNCKNNLLIIIEAADMLLPDAPIAHLMPQDRKRISITQDWFSEPGFVSGHDTVILLAESRSLIQQRIAKLPQVVSVEIPLPDKDQRKQFIEWFRTTGPKENREAVEKLDVANLAENTSGLSMHAVNQLLRSGDFSPENIVAKVEEYMESQLGEGVVEFKRPSHKLADCIGFSRIKRFMLEELIPGFKSDDPKACIAGVLFGGPIGGGKTYLGEACASEVGCPVIVLKNIRSKWYGETDQIVERLRRLVESFYKIMVFIDEADHMFSGLKSDMDVERRATGSFQTMMSDTALRGRVLWILMTARIHLLPADIRRPGRMDLIIPILDPDGTDHDDFVRWTFGKLAECETNFKKLADFTKGSSSATFSMFRSLLKQKKCQTFDEALRIVEDIVAPDIENERRYQTLQALSNCTRRSLIFGEGTNEEFKEQRKKWKQEITELEERGIR